MAQPASTINYSRHLGPGQTSHTIEQQVTNMPGVSAFHQDSTDYFTHKPLAHVDSHQRLPPPPVQAAPPRVPIPAPRPIYNQAAVPQDLNSGIKATASGIREYYQPPPAGISQKGSNPQQGFYDAAADASRQRTELEQQKMNAYYENSNVHHTSTRLPQPHLYGPQPGNTNQPRATGSHIATPRDRFGQLGRIYERAKQRFGGQQQRPEIAHWQDGQMYRDNPGYDPAPHITQAGQGQQQGLANGRGHGIRGDGPWIQWWRGRVGMKGPQQQQLVQKPVYPPVPISRPI